MILVFGKTGQVARELQNIGGVVALGREEADYLYLRFAQMPSSGLRLKQLLMQPLLQLLMKLKRTRRLPLLLMALHLP